MSSERVDWAALPGPLTYRPENVPDAISRISDANDEQSAGLAYTRFLSAVGNNHSGTYYPAAPLAVQALTGVLQSNTGWPCLTVLNILIDLLNTFEPEPGFEFITNAEGKTVSAKSALHLAIQSFEPLALDLLGREVTPRHVTALVQELLQDLDRTR